jgi:hypothetical protein
MFRCQIKSWSERGGIGYQLKIELFSGIQRSTQGRFRLITSPYHRPGHQFDLNLTANLDRSQQFRFLPCGRGGEGFNSKREPNQLKISRWLRPPWRSHLTCES